MIQSVAIVAKSKILKYLCDPDYIHPSSTGMASVEAGQSIWGAWVVQHIPAECLNASFKRRAAVDPWGRGTPPMNTSKKTFTINNL